MTEARPAAGDERHCIKCGRAIGADESMCAFCLRPGMTAPSATQYHGTMVVAIIAGVVLLAVAASIAARGIGPWNARTVAVGPLERGGVEVTLEVENLGTRTGRAQCRLLAADDSGRTLRTAAVVTPPLAGGARDRITERLPGLAEAPAEVTVACE
ncbi:MAG TPA: hypothetical protein VHK06_05160 [Candidatus Limnocylindria bacterium]|nr:hypothetical protein [Candidatus Limnocylindria bacterium]